MPPLIMQDEAAEHKLQAGDSSTLRSQLALTYKLVDLRQSGEEGDRKVHEGVLMKANQLTFIRAQLRHVSETKRQCAVHCTFAVSEPQPGLPVISR